MSDPIKEYKRFIDGLAGISRSIEARRIQAGEWHKSPPPDQAKYNILLEHLSQEQRELTAEIVQHTREAAIHDVLVLMTDRKYRIQSGEIQLAVEPFYTEMFYDFVARCAGDTWPDERLQSE